MSSATGMGPARRWLGRASMVDRWRRSSSSKSPSIAQNLSASLVSGARYWGTSYHRHRRGSLPGTISIARCRLSNRATTDGGGIVSQTGGAAVTLNDSATITGNTAGPAGGGGIFNLCGTLNGAVAGAGGNVFNDKPDNIVSACA